MWDKIVYDGTRLHLKAWNFLTFYLKFAFFIVITLVVCVIEFPIMLLRPRSVMNGLMFTQSLKHMTKILGVEWHIRNGASLAKDRGCVVIMNHQSALDVLGLYNLWHVPRKMAIVGRKEILYLIPYGWVGYLSGSIFIDRKNPEDAHKTLKNSSEALFKDKTKVILFPEGTRNNDWTRLLPFKKGAFNLAIACQVPIVPVVISPYYFFNPKKHIFNSGHAIIQCLEAVPTEGLTVDDVTDLKDRVQSIMEKTYRELSDEVLSKLPSDYPLATKN